MTDQNQQYWDDFDSAAKAEGGGGGGGGSIGKGRVDTGFKVYASGFKGHETFFSCAPGKKGERAVAKAKAMKFIEEHGVERNGDPAKPDYGIQITRYKESTFNKGIAVEWQNDLYNNVAIWPTAATEVVIPSLKEHGVLPPWEGWFRVSFRPDPYFTTKMEKYLADSGKTEADLTDSEKRDGGMTDENQDGTPRFKLVAYVAEVYANEAAAMAAVGSQDSGEGEGDSGGVPAGLKPEDWAEIQVMIKARKNAGATSAELSRTFGLPEDVIESV
uniref:Uncharacterized protein n=1 Tax=viral metagenome TaxID=1070528 RepID=A0A6M3K982_9ZZZZ